jgi:hypothetical protein
MILKKNTVSSQRLIKTCALMQRRNPFCPGNAFIIAGIYLMFAALQYVKVYTIKTYVIKSKRAQELAR